MLKTQDKSAVWLIRSLWKNKALDYTKVPILDTVFYDSSSSSYIWYSLPRLFTDKFGLLKKKTQQNSTKSQIHPKFLQISQDREILSHKLIENSFIPITKSNNDAGILDFLSLNVALQVFRPLLGDNSTKIFSEFKLDDGRPIIKHSKRYLSDGQELILPLSAQNLTEALKAIGEQVISAVEKNTNCRVLHITLIFIQDIDRKLWLMGSSTCTISEKNMFRSVTPGRTLEKLVLDGSTTTVSLKSKKPLTKCSGDFCEYQLEKPQNPNHPDDEFDDYLSKFTLSYNSSDPYKYKQEQASNVVEKEFEKIRLQKLTHKIPFRYILIGKKLLSSKPKNQTLVMFPEEIQQIEEPEYRSGDKPPVALAHPSRLYDETKVCERCYNIYSFLRTLRLKPKNYSNLPKISRDVPSYYNIEPDIVKETFQEDAEKIGKFDKMKFGMLYTLTTNKVEMNPVFSKDPDDVSSKMLTNDYLSAWTLKSQQQKNNESWQKYISTLKRKSILRNRLKSSSFK